MTCTTFFSSTSSNTVRNRIKSCTWREHAFRGEFQPDFIRRCLGIFIRRFFRQQFKRSCMPDGPKVGTISLSPRGDWRMPSDACGTVWEKAISHY